VPKVGIELVERWNQELREVGFRDPDTVATLEPVPIGWIDRDAAVDWVLSHLGGKRSAWNAADIRGRVEVLLTQVGVVADPSVRSRDEKIALKGNDVSRHDNVSRDIT
jgi:hypothetical protein